MTTTVTQIRRGNLHIGWGTLQPSRDKNVWKELVGRNPGIARFSLLENPKPRWNCFGASVLLQTLGVTLLVTLPMLFPQKLIPMMRYETVPLVAPRTDVPLPPEPPKVRAKVQPPPETPAEPPKVAKMMAPPRVVQPKPKPKQNEMKAPELNPVFQAASIAGPRAEPRRPREPVQTGLMSTGSAAPATLNRPIDQVQTGGFGDPNGLPGKGDPNKRANIAQRGSYDLPGGPGYGNGTGGANGARGTVASAGFGNGTAIPGDGGSGRRGRVQQGGFSNASAQAEAPKAKPAEGAAAVQPVVILDKPRPAYTEEARRLKLEGEVLVQVVFGADGQIHVGRVIRGLGHGLDEIAVRAAQQIRYKPAMSHGQPVDFPATVHIEFQLAY